MMIKRICAVLLCSFFLVSAGENTNAVFHVDMVPSTVPVDVSYYDTEQEQSFEVAVWVTGVSNLNAYSVRLKIVPSKYSADGVVAKITGRDNILEFSGGPEPLFIENIGSDEIEIAGSIGSTTPTENTSGILGVFTFTSGLVWGESVDIEIYDAVLTSSNGHTDEFTSPTTSFNSGMYYICDPIVVDAGLDAAICVGNTYSTNGSVSGGASTGTWTSSGTGSFDDPSLLVGAIYTPSSGDISGGSVILTLTSDDPTGPCVEASDDMVLTFDPAATAEAGTNATICEGGTYSTNGSVGGGASSGTWSSSGTGSFDFPSLLVGAVYTPSTADITAGTVNLILTTDVPSGPCGSATDFMVLTIDPAATADAGTAATICEGGTYSTNGSVGGGASSGTWSSSGTGIFNDPSLLVDAVYTPSTADITAGTVNLILTTDVPSGPCGSATDFMVLTIDPAATANAGPDDAITEGETYTLSGSIGGGASSGTWGTDGDGGFDDPNLLGATYTPGSGDIGAGTVTLTLTTDVPSGPCGSASDFMVLTINPIPEYTLTITAVNGSVTKDPNQATYTEGTVVELTATPVTDYHFMYWSGHLSGTDNPAFITMDGNKAVTAHFAHSGSITVTGLSGTEEVYIHATNGWQGKKEFNGNGTIPDLKPGVYALSIHEPGKRTEVVFATVLENDDTEVPVSLCDVIPVIFADKTVVQDYNGDPINPATFNSSVMDDINRDGDVDLVVAEAGGNIHYYLYSSGSGGLVFDRTEQISLGATEDIQCIRCTDLNADGNRELLVGLSTGEIFSLTIDDGTESVFYTAEDGLTGFDIIDANSDDEPDLLLGYEDGTVDMALSNAPGSWDSPVSMTSGGSPINVGSNAAPLAMDLDGDGIEDIIVANSIGDVIWFEGNGTMEFAEKDSVNSGGMPIITSVNTALSMGYNTTMGELPFIIVTDEDGNVYHAQAILLGDVDSDGRVFLSDFSLFVDSWRAVPGDDEWNYDTNFDVSPNNTSGKQEIYLPDYTRFVDSWRKEQ